MTYPATLVEYYEKFKKYSYRDNKELLDHIDGLMKDFPWLYELFMSLSPDKVQLAHTQDLYRKGKIYLFLHKPNGYYGPFFTKEEIINFLVTSEIGGDLTRWFKYG